MSGLNSILCSILISIAGFINLSIPITVSQDALLADYYSGLDAMKKHGDYNEALTLFLNFIRAAEGKPERYADPLMRTYCYVGIIYGSYDNYALSMDYCLKGLEMAEKIGDKRFRTALLNNIAGICLTRKQYDEARRFAKIIMEDTPVDSHQRFSYNMLMGNIALAASSPSAPASLELTAGAMGEHSAKIAFRVPETDCNGNSLPAINSLTVCNTESGKTVAVIDNPNPGEELTIEDNDPVDGMNKYEVYAANESGRGPSAFAEVWVGIDVPSPMTNFDWQLLSDGTAKITWDKTVSTGKHGGYVDVEDVSYRILTEYPDFDIYSAGKETFLDYSPVSDITDPQVMIYFEGYVKNSVGRSDLVKSHVGPVGTPYDLPYTESFAGGISQNGPWGLDFVGEEEAWGVTDYTRLSGMISQDGDAGFLAAGGFSTADGILISPLVSLKNVDEPWLTFFASRPDASAQMIVKVSTDNGLTWNELGEVGVTEGTAWEKYEFSLESYIGSDICLAFYSYVPANVPECSLDNISITDGKTGVEMLDSDTGKRMHVRVIDGTLQINGIDGVVNIYSIDGRRVADLNVEGQGSVALPRGIYLVCHGNEIIKILL